MPFLHDYIVNSGRYYDFDLTKTEIMRFGIRALFVLLVSLGSLPVVSAQRNWLTKQSTYQQIQSYLSSIDSWRATQKQSVLDAIQSLPDSVKQKLVHNAEKYLSFKWPNLPATIYLQFGENGNRTNYEKIRRERRQVLSALAIGELIEGQKRFIPQLVDGVWAICEESTWVYPAHLSIQKKYSPLPRPGENIIDLGDASTAELMSWTYLLLKDQLAQVSDILPQRIQYELERRVIQPYLSRSDFWWLGFKGQSVNNWNPTVNSGVLMTALLVENDQSRLDSAVYKTMKSVDIFINQYPADGGCDEGPGYWSMAGGALIGYLSKLKSATQGKADIASHPLIGKMGKYIYRANIDRNYFVNYGDAHATVTPNVISVYEYGEACKNDTLKQFASWFAKEGGSVYNYLYNARSALERFVDYLGICQDIANIPAKQPLIKESWLPDLQELTVRSKESSSDGLFLAAKGGTNGASHNHNDVGNFIIYADGRPAIIDLGVGTYTKQTFSKDRYKIFTMQSAWHNLPVINGAMQKAGGQYKASAVKVVAGNKATTLSMELAGAYPAAAGVDSWKRVLQFSADRIELDESYKLRQYKQPSSLSLITPLDIDVENDRLILKGNTSNVTLIIRFDPKKLRPSVLTKELTDPSLEHAWGQNVRKISFEVLSHKLSGDYKIWFEQP